MQQPVHKPKVLFLPASIRSHVLPSLYLARLLSTDYEVEYSVTNEVLAELVTENGYRASMNSGFRVGYQMEGSYLAAKMQKPTYRRLLKAYRTDELYHARKRELDTLINELRPVAIFIDLFVCTDFWLLNDRRDEFKLLFFNPMLSIYRVPGYPTVSEGYWCKHGAGNFETDPQKIKNLTLGDWLRRPKAALMHRTIQQNHHRMQEMAQALPDYPLAEDATVTQVIANVPELLLAPLEFELWPDLSKPNQYYLGLCQCEDRHDTELDTDFADQWPQLLADRQPGEKWIYCSFGTFHEGADSTLLRFVTNLLDIVRDWPTVRLICAVNKYLIETLRARNLIPANAHFFSRVPQLSILAEANVFITHGGFGSIKESIHYGVPMLVYPLDPKYDQNGNALKVELHCLGMRGLFAHERTGDLKKKIKKLLEEETYKVGVRKFKQIMRKYLEDEITEKLKLLLTGERKGKLVENEKLATI